jgi:hypothetical protein
MGNKVIQEIDPLEVIRDIGKKNKRLQAKLLQRIELHVNRTDAEYPELRKFILDETSGFTRSILKDIFGDIEFLLGD